VPVDVIVEWAVFPAMLHDFISKVNKYFLMRPRGTYDAIVDMVRQSMKRHPVRQMIFQY